MEFNKNLIFPKGIPQETIDAFNRINKKPNPTEVKNKTNTGNNRVDRINRFFDIKCFSEEAGLDSDKIDKCRKIYHDLLSEMGKADCNCKHNGIRKKYYKLVEKLIEEE